MEQCVNPSRVRTSHARAPRGGPLTKARLLISQESRQAAPYEMWKRTRSYFRDFGYRQVPIWYGSSVVVADQFETISKNLKFLKLFPNPYPFYDWIMGFHERWSNRAALRCPVLERTANVIEAGVGTGYFLGQLVKKARNAATVCAIDLSPQMISAAKSYITKKNLASAALFFVRSDCRHLPYADGTFDLYVSSYLLDLLNDEEIESTLQEMERVLAPDGHAILITMMMCQVPRDFCAASRMSFTAWDITAEGGTPSGNFCLQATPLTVGRSLWEHT